jgi:hypothetical protein
VLVTNWPQCLAPGDHLIQHGGERVMVVSFMIAAPLPWRRPLCTASPLLRTPPPRSDTASRISSENFPGGQNPGQLAPAISGPPEGAPTALSFQMPAMNREIRPFHR